MNINLKELSEDQLRSLHTDIQLELNNRDPRIIQQRKEQEQFWADYAKRSKEKAKHCDEVRIALAKLLKPGMRIKMKGCKDGKGIREFIKWDNNDNLVCWQIRVSRQWKKTGMGDKGQFVTTETKTNQVTTHMADKVSWVLIDNAQVPVNKFIT